MTEHNKKHYISNPFSVMANGMSALFKYNQNLAIIILVASLVSSGLNIFNGFPGSFGGDSGQTTGSSGTTDNPWLIGSIVAIVGVIVLLVIVVSVVISTLYNGIVAYTILKTSKHETASFKEALSAAMSKFWTLLWIDIVVFLKILGGILLFVIPGIRASLRYTMVRVHVFDENASAKQAIQKAKNLTKDHLMEVFGVVSLAGLVPFAGPILSIGGQTVMYPQLKHLKATNAAKPPVHWLNYLSIIIVIGFLTLILGFVALAFLLVSATQ